MAENFIEAKLWWLFQEHSLCNKSFTIKPTLLSQIFFLHYFLATLLSSNIPEFLPFFVKRTRTKRAFTQPNYSWVETIGNRNSRNIFRLTSSYLQRYSRKWSCYKALPLRSCVLLLLVFNTTMGYELWKRNKHDYSVCISHESALSSKYNLDGLVECEKKQQYSRSTYKPS